MSYYTLNDLRAKAKKFFPFTNDERKTFIISVILMWFILTFKEDPEDVSFFFNAIASLIIALAVIWVHEAAHRLLGLQIGFKVEMKMIWIGLAASLILFIAFSGKLWWILVSPAIFIEMLPVHRLGYFRYGLNMLANAAVGFIGPLVNIIMALIAKIVLIGLPGNFFLEKFIAVNVAYAIFNMLPIPPLDGSRVIFHSRLIYVFSYGSLIGMGIMLAIPFKSLWGILICLIGALIIGTIIWFAWLQKIEGGAGQYAEEFVK